MTEMCACPPEIHKLVKGGYFKSNEEALKRAAELLVRENKMVELKKRMDKTAGKVGKLKGKSLSRLVEEMHEEEDEL